MSIGQRGESSLFVQYGVSSLVNNKKPVQVRATSLLTPKADGNSGASSLEKTITRETGDKFYYLDNDKQFFGFDKLYDSKGGNVYRMSGPMRSASQHARKITGYKVDGIHVHTQAESDTSKGQIGCACNYEKTEPNMIKEIDAAIRFEGSNMFH